MRTAISILILCACFALLNRGRSEISAQNASSNSNGSRKIVEERADDAVWSAPSNNLALGVKFWSVSARVTKEPTVAAYLENVGPTNMAWEWLAPPDFRRIDLTLYDAAGREVQRVPGSRSSPERHYRFLWEVPKDWHGVRLGTLFLPANDPIPYEATNLMSVFRIETPGEYRLIAKGRIMRKGGQDSALTIVELPAVGVTLHLSDADVRKEKGDQP